ncbi:hypothetical protein BG015_001239 [Linnemannia schmuckeri]|uniref:3CxxC-type domain-containing protein n=1 Tax=Linnemannia schmuckeri TaxID=64567 RepID=A0A9P5VDI1_9FUNG|nr:hypothetical protein BG015_001239 [Linnemannia schmuckeri]
MGFRPVSSTFTSAPPLLPPRKLAGGKEFDGSYLHAAVARESDSRYKYDDNLTKATSRRDGSRSILGHFICKACNPSRSWYSGNICTELFIASNDRYRTILHAQQCRRCETYIMPEVDEGNYVQKIVSALDLWINRPERKEFPSDYRKTKPHDKERCHGCQIGVCIRQRK